MDEGLGMVGRSNAVGWLALVAALGACGRIGFDDAVGHGTGGPDASTGLPPGCAALPPASGTVVTVTPAMAAELRPVFTALAPGTTLVFAPGQYDISPIAPLVIRADDVVIRSASGDPADVTIVGDFTSPLVSVQASRVMISGLTLRRGSSALQLADTTSASDIVLYKLRTEQDAANAVHAPGGGTYADRVTLACSTIALGDTGRAALAAAGRSCQTAGVKVVGGRTWNVFDNSFEGYWCAAGEAIAVAFQGGSRDLVFTRNRIVNSFVGLRIGLAFEPPRRTYADEPPCASGKPAVSAMQARVFDNIVAEDGSARPSFDSAIALWSTCDADVVHNTVSVRNADVFSAIEYRYAVSTGVRILNNAITDVAVSGGGGSPLRARDGAVADLRGNVVGDDAVLFARTGTQPLAPAVGSPLRDAADCTGDPPGCDVDYYGVARGRPADVGAIEVK